MEGQRFFIKGESFSADDVRLQDALGHIYATPERPRCMCIPDGVEMYVAKHRQYAVKRMPGTGNKHHPSCASFEPAYEQSGLGELIGDAVIERSPELIELRVDFPLARIPGKAVPRGEPVPSADISTGRRRMSLRAVMHYLFERAGFNRWTPAMEGKRTQGVIHKYLLEAAAEIEMKGARLLDRLYVPESFSAERKAEIAERRRNKLAILLAPEDATQFKMALVLGEFKEAESVASGRKVRIRHMPDAPLFIDNKEWERIVRVYGDLFEAVDADIKTRPRLVLCALVYAKSEHTYRIDTASFILTTENWIPIDGMHELGLLQALIDRKRRFVKPMHYDAPPTMAFANALLLDTGERSTPLYVLSTFLGPKERTATERAIQECGAGTWVWNTEMPMPALPPPAVDYRGNHCSRNLIGASRRP